MDLATILQSDRKPAEAVAVYERANRPDPPAYALAAATHAYRDLRRFDDAARLARDGIRRFPADPSWALLLSLVLSDGDHAAEALDLLRGPAALRAPPVERLLAQAYAYRRGGNRFAAMRAYAEALRLAPANREVRAETAVVLREMRAPYGAAQVVGTTPAIAADEVGAMVGWGAEVRPPEPARRYEGTDAALARLDALLASAPVDNADLRRHLRLDRVVALRDRARMAEALAEAESLRGEAALPPYVERAYADALLALRRPGEARDAYARVLAQTPRDFDARYGQFYAAVDLEDFATAFAAVDALVADQPIWRSYAGDPTRYDDPDRTYAEVTATRARLYGNQLGEAWDRIAQMAAAAPANGAIRLTEYQVASARGWPRRAAAEAEIAASLQPRDIDTRIALVEVAMANYRFDEAARLLGELQLLYPENQAVRRLARELDAKRRWVLELEARPISTTGGGQNAVGQELELHGKLYSPPIADNFRLFGFGDYASAQPIEGFVSRTRAGGGLEWRVPDITATIFPTTTWGTLNRAGGGATVDWSVSDQIKLSLAGELFSADTPMRALFYGITSNEVSARAAWRWHESRSIVAAVAYQPFSDGNQRTSAGVSYSEKLINLPHFDLTGRAEAFTSNNTLSNVPYYSPAADFSVTAGLLVEHMLWRRYDISLVQALSVDAGLYAERGFSDNWIGTVSYEHRWRFDPLTEFHYGVFLSRRFYDGSELDGIAGVVGLRWRI